jgi:hypothetical protein
MTNDASDEGTVVGIEMGAGTGIDQGKERGGVNERKGRRTGSDAEARREAGKGRKAAVGIGKTGTGRTGTGARRTSGIGNVHSA